MNSQDLQQQALPQEQDTLLKAEIDHLKNLNQDLSTENKELKLTIDHLSNLLLEKTQGNEYLESQFRLLLQEQDRISDEISFKYAEIDGWRQKHIEIEQKFERSQQENEKNRRFIEEQIWSSTDLKSAHISLLSENERLHNELILKNKELESCRTKQNDLEKELIILGRQEFHVMNSRTPAMESRLTSALRDLDLSYEKLDLVKKENSELQLQIKELKENLSHLESLNERTNTLLIEKQKEIDSLKSRTAEAKSGPFLANDYPLS